MKTPLLILLLLVGRMSLGEPLPNNAAVLEVANPPYLYEVIRHLYRWHLDEDDIERAAGHSTVECWIQPMKMTLDPGDQSQWVKLYLPQLDFEVTLKKTDYRVEELDLEVKSQGFKIVNVAHVSHHTTPPTGATTLRLDADTMVQRLFETRNQAIFPDEALGTRLRNALKEQLGALDETPDETTEIVHIAPIPPVANVLWIYWETAQKLIRFASDIDLTNPAVWAHEVLAIDCFDIEDQVVVSFDETPGSNAYLTRDEVGRVIYNCMLHGKRHVIETQPKP